MIRFEGVPEIGTTATVDGEHTAEPAGEVTIVDTVTYKNLKVGQTYKVSGVLMDKSTEEPLLMGEQQITAELEFTPDSADGTVGADLHPGCQRSCGQSRVVLRTFIRMKPWWRPTPTWRMWARP